MPFETSLRNTCIFLAIFILAFFPSAFQVLLKPILLPFEILTGSDFGPKIPVLPTCNCCPPASCSTATTQIQTVPNTMSWFQKTFALPSKSRGSYLITDHVVKELPELKDYKVGILHLFVQHTSCGLSLNENWDEDVREDMSDALDRIAPEDRKVSFIGHSPEKDVEELTNQREICTGIPQRDSTICPHTSNQPWWAQVSQFQSAMVSSTQEHGRESGTWNFGRASIRGKSSLPSKGRRRD